MTGVGNDHVFQQQPWPHNPPSDDSDQTNNGSDPNHRESLPSVDTMPAVLTLVCAGCLCVCVCVYVLRTVSQDKILRCINTFIIIISVQAATLLAVHVHSPAMRFCINLYSHSNFRVLCFCLTKSTIHNTKTPFYWHKTATSSLNLMTLFPTKRVTVSRDGVVKYSNESTTAKTKICRRCDFPVLNTKSEVEAVHCFVLYVHFCMAVEFNNKFTDNLHMCCILRLNWRSF